MGFRFSIEQANWLAHVLQPAGATPQLENKHDQESALETFLHDFQHNFYAARPESWLLRELLDELRHSPRFPSRHAPLLVLREYFRNIPWIALLIPSGRDHDSDSLLMDRELLRELVSIRPEDPGLILQLKDRPLGEEIRLDHVFPAFKVALAEVTRWPGALVWTPTGNAAFFELSKDRDAIRKRLRWVFSHLATNVGSPDLQLLKQQFSREMLAGEAGQSMLRLIHLSDLHLGSQHARRRLARVQVLIESVIGELGEEAPIVPVITGDLMDSPNDANLGDLRAFMGFLDSLGIEKPVVVLGNHDVREDGWLSPNLQQAINISREPVVWADEQCVGFACFNSVNGGHLARGWIGEQELAHVGNAIDKEPAKASSYTIIAALHHHPIPVDRPSWYRRYWYERLIGNAFETTEALKDADLFLGWLEARKIPAVLHGHKHIPRFDMHGNTAIIGCGSTVGKVETSPKGQTFMSLNVITVDRTQNLLGCRLRGERIPGAGLDAGESHELVLRSPLATGV